jgi:hypothetical protein
MIVVLQIWYVLYVRFAFRLVVQVKVSPELRHVDSYRIFMQGHD